MPLSQLLVRCTTHCLQKSMPVSIQTTYIYFLLTVTFHSHNISTSLLWLGHRCQFPGCQVALVMDGNLKNRRDVCMAREAGYIEYEGVEEKIKTGCMNTPEQKSQYCTLHKPRACDPITRHCSEETPPEPLARDQGNVQLILEKKVTRTVTYYKVVGQASLILYISGYYLHVQQSFINSLITFTLLLASTLILS